MTTITFYNKWHNGDVFSGREYVRNLMRQYPGFDYRYSLDVHPHCITDLRCKTFPTRELPEGVGDSHQGCMTGDDIYINTWVGAYMRDVFLPGESHANWPSLLRQWKQIYDQINQVLNIRLELPSAPLDGIPSVDWSVYNTEPADKTIGSKLQSKVILFCNGDVQSGQSPWGDWRELIDRLASKMSDTLFICTQKFDTTTSNILFTNDIFQQPCDLNEIAYLSRSCDVIVGKNSGPFMFTHVHENIFNPQLAFLACSDRPSDSYPHGVTGLGCHYFHSLTEDEAALESYINYALQHALNARPQGKMVILGKEV